MQMSTFSSLAFKAVLGFKFLMNVATFDVVFHSENVGSNSNFQ